MGFGAGYRSASFGNGYPYPQGASSRHQSPSRSYLSAYSTASMAPMTASPALSHTFDPTILEHPSSRYGGPEAYQQTAGEFVDPSMSFLAHAYPGQEDASQQFADPSQHGFFDQSLQGSMHSIGAASSSPEIAPIPHHPAQYQSTSSLCSCHQSILRELFKISSDPNSTSMPLDKALSTNQVVVTVCASALACPNHQYDRSDITFLLVLVSLLIHAANVFDAIVSARYEVLHMSRSRSGSGSESTAPSVLGAGEYFEGADRSAPLTPRSNAMAYLPTPPSEIAAGVSHAMMPVHLTSDPYQPSQQLEDAFQWNLLKVELSKLQRLVDELDHRFSRPGVNLVDGWENLDWSAEEDSRMPRTQREASAAGDPRIVGLLLADLRKRMQRSQRAFAVL